MTVSAPQNSTVTPSSSSRPPGRRHVAVALLSACALVPICVGQPAGVPRDDFWVPDGPVRSVLETNGVVYVAGSFNFVSPVGEVGGAFDAVSGSPFQGFPKFGGVIKTIVVDGTGGWFVGGLFNYVGDVAVTNLARIRPDRTVDPSWRSNPDGEVLALALGDDILFVGGAFGSIGGQSRSLLAALHPRTAETLAWRADVTNTLGNPSVRSLVLSDDVLYVGGYFSYINDVEREHVGAVDALTGKVTGWFPNGLDGSQSNARIDAMAILDRVLYVGGTFGRIGGGTNDGLVRLSIAALDTTKNGVASVLPWNPGLDGAISSIRCLAASCDSIYAGGLFTRIGGTNRNHLAALDPITGRARDWNPDPDGEVLTLVRAGTLVYAGGRFTRIGGQARSSLAALDAETGQATAWNPRADFGVSGVALAGGGGASAGGIVVAGGLAPGGAVSRKGLAAFDARTAKLLDWNPIVAGATLINGLPVEGVFALAASGNTIYLGGPFTSINGQPRNRLAAVDASSGALRTNWNPNADGIIEALGVSPAAVYAGGAFTSAGGSNRANLAALTLDTGKATAWNPGANVKVTSLLPSGSTLFVGGNFTAIGGDSSHRYVAAINTGTGLPTAWDPKVNSQVSALALAEGQLYLGGFFTRAGTQAVSRIAAVDAGTASLTCWRPEASAGVNALVAAGQHVYAGGAFATIGGATRRGLSALGTNCPGPATDWNPTVEGLVNSLASARGSLFAGGAFTRVGGRVRPNFVAFAPAGAPTVSVTPADLQVSVGAPLVLTAIAAGVGPFAYQWQLNGTNLIGATGPTLRIDSARVADSGNYTVVVTNALGLINSRPAGVMVIEPVRIQAQPVSQPNVAPGATVTLSVTATGNPPPVYQWRLNGSDIPGAVHSTYTITNAQPADGGSYSVAVASAAGATNSAIALVIVSSPALPFRDNFGDLASGTILGPSGLGSGNNATATTERPAETNHVGKPGGHSLWLRWIAPAKGIATFSTRGSSFDTLLAVYTGSTLGQLTPVTADEDAGGHFTSQLAFNADAGTEYRIVVDGFAGASGHVVLGWNLDTNAAEFPRILRQPRSVTVTNRADATFTVEVADSPSPLRYQWFHECRAIVGATNATLEVQSVRPAGVGSYHVEVMNSSTRIARSFDVSLDIGPDVRVVAQDKLEDLLSARSAPAGDGFLPATTSDSGGFVSVTIGSIDFQIINNSTAGIELAEPNHCGVLGGASKWIGLRAETNGTMIIDTIGSTADTVLAVYFATNYFYLPTALVTCDNNGAPDGIRSLVKFQAQKNTDYLVVVDGVNKDKNIINVNWKLGTPPPTGPTAPSSFTLIPGGSITLSANTNNAVPPPSCQWFLNGVAIAGATQANLTLSALQPIHAGTYTVLVSNLFGSVLQTNAIVRVANPLRLTGPSLDRNGSYQFSVAGGPTDSRWIVIETTTNLSNTNDWAPVLTNPVTGPPLIFLDTNAPRFPRRFYRAISRP